MQDKAQDKTIVHLLKKSALFQEFDEVILEPLSQYVKRQECGWQRNHA